MVKELNTYLNSIGRHLLNDFQEGAAAREAGRARYTNPYEGDDMRLWYKRWFDFSKPRWERRNEWYRGWQSADDELTKRN